MNIMMYVVITLVVLLALKPTKKMVLSSKRKFKELYNFRKKKNDYEEKGWDWDDAYESILERNTRSLKEGIERISSLVFTGFCYGIGFCIAVWWLFPWLYK